MNSNFKSLDLTSTRTAPDSTASRTTSLCVKSWPMLCHTLASIARRRREEEEGDVQVDRAGGAGGMEEEERDEAREQEEEEAERVPEERGEEEKEEDESSRATQHAGSMKDKRRGMLPLHWEGGRERS